MMNVSIGTAESGVAGALMFDAALEQRGALTGYNFPTKAEREQVRHHCTWLTVQSKLSRSLLSQHSAVCSVFLPKRGFVRSELT